jgi:hypothetical protein
MTDESRVDVLARMAEPEPELVDNEVAVTPPAFPPQETELRDREADLDRQRREKSELTAKVLPKLVLSPANLARGQQVRQAFEASGTDSDVGERLLEELVAAEVPVALELQRIEGALTAFLGEAMLESEAALQVVKVLKETVGLSNAVRTRMSNALAAAANLRAHRNFLKEHRRPSGG